MDIRDTCNAFTNDMAYIKALTGNNENEKDKAWVCLYKTYQGYINTVLLKLGLDNNDEENIKDAEDAYQESIIAVVNMIRNGKFITAKAKISTYLFACCKYQLIKMKKRQSRFVIESYTPVQKMEMDKEIDLLIKQEMDNEYQLKVGIIKKAVAELRKSCADILHRVLYDGQTLAIIAAEKKITFHYAEIEFSRCKKNLVELLISKYKFPPDGLWL